MLFTTGKTLFVVGALKSPLRKTEFLGIFGTPQLLLEKTRLDVKRA
jgi:hypothetical protein